MPGSVIRLRDGRQIEVDSETAAEVRMMWQELEQSHPDRALEIDARDGGRVSVRLGDIEAVDSD